jgi:hypothetical protein
MRKARGLTIRRPLPVWADQVTERLVRIEPLAGTTEEPDAVRQAYELMLKANFSRAVLEVEDRLATAVTALA